MMYNHDDRETMPVRRISSLKDIQPRLMRVLIPDGSEQIEFVMRELSHQERDELDRSVPTPTPQRVSDVVDMRKVGGQLARIYEIDEQRYADDIQAVNTRRALLRLQAALIMEIDGDTAEERATALEKALPTPVLTALMKAYNMLSEREGVRIEALADQFHSRSGGDQPRVPADGLVDQS